MSLQTAISHLLAAKRISNTTQSYAKDNPGEWAKVKGYLEGGPRPSGVVTEMGVGLIEVEDARRGSGPPPDPEPEPGGWYPASWQLSGPLEAQVPLPPRQGAFLILWPGQPGGPTTWTQFQQRIALREQQWGRKPDAIMSSGPEGTTIEASLAWIRDHGCLPIVAGLNFGNHDGVLNGSKNAAIDAYAQKMKALGVKVMIRLHHEFNYSHLSYTSVGQEQKFIASWKYIVNRFHGTNGATNVGFWFCPAEGGDGTARASADTCFSGLSPTFIDWAGSDSYNHCFVGESGCYSTPWTPGYTDFGPLFDYSKLGGQTIQSRHDKWGVTKPFVIGETGTVFDPNNPTRKAQWLRSVPPAAKQMEYLAGIAFFDIDATAWEDARNNWILDHRTDVAEIKNAMVEMARDPWLNTKAPITVAPPDPIDEWGIAGSGLSLIYDA